MNKNITAKVNMFTQVEEVLQTHQNIVDTSSAFITAAAYLSEQLNRIEEKTKPLALKITGYAEGKKTAKIALCKQLVLVRGGLAAFAEKIADPALGQKVKYSYSSLLRIRDTELPDTASAIYDLAILHRTDIADYNVSNLTIEKLNTAIETFKTYNPKPRTAMITNKTTRGFLKKLVDNLNNFLRFEMDPLADTFEEAHPEFYGLYHNARRNYSEGVRHRRPALFPDDGEDAVPTTAPKAITEQPSADELLRQAMEGVVANGDVQAGA